MKLFKVSQDIHNQYDTFDSMIVCAKSEDDARNISPDEWWDYKNGVKTKFHDGWDRESPDENTMSWIAYNKRDKVTVEYIGEVKSGIPKGVVLASFNAG
jgi:hypothetical protein